MITRRIVLHFPHKLVGQPIVCSFVKDYNLEFNILKASVNPKEEGLVVLEVKGKEKDFEGGLDFLKKKGVRVQPLSKDIKRDEDKCTHCGACVIICPVDAFVVDKKTRQVNFDQSKCIACELCVPACPVRAMEVHF